MIPCYLVGYISIFWGALSKYFSGKDGYLAP